MVGACDWAMLSLMEPVTQFKKHVPKSRGLGMVSNTVQPLGTEKHSSR